MMLTSIVLTVLSIILILVRKWVQIHFYSSNLTIQYTASV